MAIVGAHVLLYTSEAERLRETVRDVLGLFTLMCDDLNSTMAELGEKGIEFRAFSSSSFRRSGSGRTDSADTGSNPVCASS